MGNVNFPPFPRRTIAYPGIPGTPVYLIAIAVIIPLDSTGRWLTDTQSHFFFFQKYL